MKAWLLGAFSLTLGSLACAEAATRAPDRPHPIMAPLEEAATACFADTVLSNPAAMRHARAGRWYEAAGVIGFLCRPEVDAMARALDALHGRGAGERYFKTAYTRHLGRELAARLAPMLETKAVATAEPPADKASLAEAADKAE